MSAKMANRYVAPMNNLIYSLFIKKLKKNQAKRLCKTRRNTKRRQYSQLFLR